MHSEQDTDSDNDIKEKKTIPIYRNDIKFRKHRNIDQSNADWADESIKHDYLNVDTDDIPYRLQDCERERNETLDISNLNIDNCFEKLFVTKKFQKVKTTIQHIFASNSGISVIPDLSELTSLITLDLSHNRLTSLPNLPKSLEELVINDNEIVSIEHNLPNLKRFVGTNNKIQKFNYDSCSKSLEKFIINCNPINYIKKIDNVYHLNISNTLINSIYTYPKLRYLDCSHTKIKKIPENNKLEDLITSYSDVNDIRDILSLHNLEIINTDVTVIHHMKNLSKLVCSSDLLETKKIVISKHYILSHIKKNTQNVTELVFKT